MKFHTNNDIGDYGFVGQYLTNYEECGGTLYQPYGTIYSTPFPAPYKNNQNCIWQIRLQARKIFGFWDFGKN